MNTATKNNRLGRWLLACLLAWSLPLAAQTVTLNLKDADINALIGTVAEVTGRNFIVDPRVKGKVTVISSRPMDGEEVYQVFESILRVHGFAAVPSGEVIKIVPDVNAKQDSIPNVSDRAPGQGDEMVTRVVSVDNVSASQLVPILRPLVPQQGHLAAYPTTNVLIISDRARNVERLVDIIRRIDTVSDSEIEVIPLQHASAAEVVRILTAINRADPGQPKGIEGGGPTMVADERTNSILLGGDRASRLRLRVIISHLDTPLDRGGNTKVIYLKYAKAKDLVEVLTGVGKTQSEELKGKEATAGGDKQLDIHADEATNALVITAPPDLMLSLESVIRQLDIRRQQIMVDAIIAEVTMSKARQLGVQWAIDGHTKGGAPVGGTNFSNFGTPIASLIAGANSNDVSGAIGALSPGLLVGGGKFNSGNVDFGVVLQALGTDSDTNVLSTPSLVTLDNEEAEIVVGQNVPFVTGSFTNTGATSGSTNPFQTIQREDVGITLKVTPQINEGNAIVMKIEQEVSSVSDSASSASDIITNKRSIKTNVLVENGQVLVLGGLMEDKVRESEQKVPILGDIPLLGYLFRSKQSTGDKTNLMVFLHPVILNEAAVASSYTAEKYNMIRAKKFEMHGQGIEFLPDEFAPNMPELNELLELPPPYRDPTAPALPDADVPPPAEAPAGSDEAVDG